MKPSIKTQLQEVEKKLWKVRRTLYRSAFETYVIICSPKVKMPFFQLQNLKKNICRIQRQSYQLERGE